MNSAVDHAHVGDHAAVLVELGVEDERPRRRVEVALRRRDAAHDRLEQLLHPLAGLGGDPDRLLGVVAEQLVDLAGHALGLGAGQVDLVQRGDQLEAAVDGQVGVGERLRLDALGGVHEQQRAVAGLERSRDLVREVDVPGRVDQVQAVGLAVLGLVLHAHGLRLDRDAALALELHRVEHLRAVLARVDGPGDLEDAIGQRRLPMVDVGNDREVADVAGGCAHTNDSRGGRGMRPVIASARAGRRSAA